jgi:hypothetical protein
MDSIGNDVSCLTRVNRSSLMATTSCPSTTSAARRVALVRVDLQDVHGAVTIESPPSLKRSRGES